MKTGYLIVNLGTPDSPSTQDVRRYLGEFLMDGYVIDAPWPVRKLIVSAFILPFRPKRSAEAYETIWTGAGSPLLINTLALAERLRARLEAPVAVGMRYGSPSIRDGIDALKADGVEHIVIAPLYPQYADSTVTTTVAKAKESLGGLSHSVLPPFFEAEEFIEPQARLIEAELAKGFDHLLLSYHGLPERHLTRTDPTENHCLKRDDCCAKASSSPAHATCYRHQAFMTSHALAARLGLREDQWSMSFQSRLGRLPWLTPYTDERLESLPNEGVKRLVVACPAFVADNLETLEEIAIQGRDTFLNAGGESLTLAPCVNAEADWSEGLAALLERQAATVRSAELVS